MRRLLLIFLAGLWASTCHINEVAEVILDLKLDDSLKTCARLDIVLINPADSAQLDRVWNAAPPDPLSIRHTLTRAGAGDFLVRIECVDGADQVKTIKTIPYRGGNMGLVHVVHGPEARYEIAAFKLLDSTDRDGDGHFRGYRAVLDVNSNTNFDTLRVSISYQLKGNANWSPLIPSRLLPIRGSDSADSMSLGIEGGARRIISLKAEIRTVDGKPLDEARIVDVHEETPGQDSAGLRWVFRNYSGAVLTLNADVGTDTLSNRRVGQNDSVVVSLAAKSAEQKISYVAVARGPGEPLEWRDDLSMEMDRFQVEVEAGHRDSHFVLNLVNNSDQAVTGIILNPGTPGERTFSVDIPSLPENRNLGLFPYETGTTVAFRLSGGGTRTFNSVGFSTHPVFEFRFAEFTLDP